MHTLWSDCSYDDPFPCIELTPAERAVFLPEMHVNSVQAELLEMLIRDRSYQEIADFQRRSYDSIAHQVNYLVQKLGCRSAVGLAAWWVRSRGMLLANAERPKAAGAVA